MEAKVGAEAPKIPKTNQTISNDEGIEFPLHDILKKSGEEILLKQELAGRPETKFHTWHLQKATWLQGFVSGGDLGFALGLKMGEREARRKIENAQKEN